MRSHRAQWTTGVRDDTMGGDTTGEDTGRDDTMGGDTPGVRDDDTMGGVTTTGGVSSTGSGTDTTGGKTDVSNIVIVETCSI